MYFEENWPQIYARSPGQEVPCGHKECQVVFPYDAINDHLNALDANSEANHVTHCIIKAKWWLEIWKCTYLVQ